MEDKGIKRKKILKILAKVVSYFFISLLIAIIILLLLYVVTNKIAEKKGTKAPFGLYTIISPSMVPNIKVYDVVFVKYVDTNSLEVGDIITFYSTNLYFGGTPITHRIVNIIEMEGSERKFVVKGDANESVDKEKVLASNVIGKVVFKIPQLGRIQFFLASKGGWIIGIMIPALTIIGYDIYKLIRLLILKSRLAKMKN